MCEAANIRAAANTVRALAADAIQKAKSGHPGMPLGAADYAITLFQKYLRFDPSNPSWIGRDRFVLSAGHGSMLEYALLHLYGYGLSMDELKNFRQLNSKTPGHPEFGHTAGVDITTGPLGSGFASAVGMAIADEYVAAVTGLDKSGIQRSRIFVVCGDGCLMEGASSEAGSLAGHLKLDNIICFYDDNSISIEGSTSLAFTEDVAKRFEAFGWRIIRCADANDPAQCDAALAEAVVSDGRPTMIIGKTKIGYGAPNKQGKSSSHGEPLGPEEVIAMKKNLGISEAEFYVSDEVAAYCGARVEASKKAAAEWNEQFKAFIAADADRAALADKFYNCTVPEDILEQLLAAAPVDKPMATRASSGVILNAAAKIIPSLLGGSADLAPSTKTDIKGAEGFSAENRAGRNLHFGVRELAMGLAGNGMALSGSIIPYTSTFFVFSDYMKPAIRLAALMQLHELYIFTHDSFYVGEDGPTHEPIEQIAMLRTIPGLTVYRPAEAHEVAHCYAASLKAKGPSVILCTRQDLRPYTPEQAAKIDVTRGAYVISDDADADLIFIATGSEVNLALDAAEIARANGAKVRVVSMVSMENFFAQDKEYRDSVLPPAIRKRVSIEAASTFGWEKVVGDEGLSIGLDHFGASAPYKALAEEFGFTPEKVIAAVKAHFTVCKNGCCSCCC